LEKSETTILKKVFEEKARLMFHLL